MSRRKLPSLSFNESEAKKREKKIPTKSLGYVAAHLSFDVSPIMKRSIGRGGKLEEVNYQQIFTLACALDVLLSVPFPPSPLLLLSY